MLLSQIGNRIVADNQRAVFAKLLNEGLGFFSDRHSTEFIARLTAGATAATQVINLLVTSIGRDLLSLIGLITVMVVQDPLMSFFSFVVAPPAFFVLRKLIRRIYAIARSQFDGGARIMETLQETLQGIRIVKAFTLEDVMRERFDRNVAAVEHEANKMARVVEPRQPADGDPGRLRHCHGHHLWRLSRDRNRRDAGPVFLVHRRLPAGLRAGQAPGRLNIELNSGLVGVRILFEVLDLPPSEPPTICGAGLAGQLSAARARGRRILPIVATKPCLCGMSLVAEPGRLTALVGPSGGGKSTVFNLILRFYDPERGRIVIDGQDITKVSRRSLRRHIAYVGQDVFLFRGTIRENIAVRQTGRQRGRDRRRRQERLCA